MTTKQKLLNLIGLAMRARKTITGTELVIEGIQRANIDLVFVASDASENTIKKVTDKAKYYGVSYSTDLSSDELSQAIGKPRKVVAIQDKGFAESMEDMLKELDR